MPRLLEVTALEGFRLWLRYDDGSAGEVDVSDLAGRGVFKAWADPAFFGAVALGAHGDIAWGDQIDLCPDAMYMRLTGKTPEQVFPGLNKAAANA